mmetsp:Transcript_12368/g.19987  ORF Transcript_12368/g.19987 Transcript_12368/m.19987 type:complete len:306 (+) Transcript_12368:57-974(+)
MSTIRGGDSQVIAAGFDHEIVKVASIGKISELVKLLDAKASTGQLGSAKTKIGRAALIKAAGKGQILAMHELIRRGAEPDCYAADKLRRPLHEAVGVQKLPAVLYLLEAGASTEVEDGRFQRTPLLWACDQGTEDIARALLEAGANPEARDLKRMTALLLASASGHTPIAKLLVRDYNADAGARDARFGRTALEWAISHGHEDTSVYLFLHADVRVHNLKFCLDQACAFQNVRLVAIVLLSAAETNEFVIIANAAKHLPESLGSHVCRDVPRSPQAAQEFSQNLNLLSKKCHQLLIDIECTYLQE